MPKCPNCRKSLGTNRERIGARCPFCRDPLYELPERLARREPEVAGFEENYCAVHSRNLACGPCKRCGNFLCSVCRTRWRNQWVCLACVERAMEDREFQPEAIQAHYRQAVGALVCGGASWLLTIMAVGLFAAGLGKESNPALRVSGILLLLVCPWPGLIGVGLGAAAVRIRGDHMIMATAGLVLSGLLVGVFLGLFAFGAWFS